MSKRVFILVIVLKVVTLPGCYHRQGFIKPGGFIMPSIML